MVPTAQRAEAALAMALPGPLGPRLCVIFLKRLRFENLANFGISGARESADAAGARALPFRRLADSSYSRRHLER